MLSRKTEIYQYSFFFLSLKEIPVKSKMQYWHYPTLQYPQKVNDVI